MTDDTTQATRALLAALTSEERWDKTAIDNLAEAVRAALPPEPDAPLKSIVTLVADYGPLGRVSIMLPECNGGDEQFEADFDATLSFVRGVMERRKSARAVHKAGQALL